MIVLDANVWISFLDSGDSNHLEAEKIVNNIAEPIVVPEYVLVEVLNVVTRRVGKKVADCFAESLLDSRIAVIDYSSKNFLNQVLRFWLSTNMKRLSFVDHSLLLMSGISKVITFDRDLSRAITEFVRGK